MKKMEMNGDERKKRLIGRHDQEFFVEMLQVYSLFDTVKLGNPVIFTDIYIDLKNDTEESYLWELN